MRGEFLAEIENVIVTVNVRCCCELIGINAKECV